MIGFSVVGLFLAHAVQWLGVFYCVVFSCFISGQFLFQDGEVMLSQLLLKQACVVIILRFVC